MNPGFGALLTVDVCLICASAENLLLVMTMTAVNVSPIAVSEVLYHQRNKCDDVLASLQKSLTVTMNACSLDVKAGLLVAIVKTIIRSYVHPNASTHYENRNSV